ncbi:MAG TPA: 2-phospho-L-lactate transferase [Candidatus Xenobia bacterium]|jgi:LPPG:FO 2-phospho-L-lactate transferase
MICALAGGVGGARLADGLAQAGLDDLRIVVNTGDDFVHLGLDICPDLDTVMYTLAGLAHPVHGWGIENDTAHAMSMLERYHGTTWFQLTDRDIGTHLYRTDRLRQGHRLTDITTDMARCLGITAHLLPMADTRVATRVLTPVGELSFQDYFVRRRHQDKVLSIRWDGLDEAVPTPDVMHAVREAQAIVLCPSNPMVSIGPILALPALRETLRRRHVPRLAVSPIIGGQALKGPADQMLVSLGHESSALGVAKLYADILDAFVMDRADAALKPAVEALGLRVLVTDTIMRDRTDRLRLAREILEFARTVPQPR